MKNVFKRDFVLFIINQFKLNLFLEFASTQIPVTSQIFDFMNWFCREFFADSNATSKYSFFICLKGVMG